MLLSRERLTTTRGATALATAMAAMLLALPAPAGATDPGAAAPVAQAGADQVVDESAVVTLDGSGSRGATRPVLEPSSRRGNLPGGTSLGVELVDLTPDASAARAVVDLGQGPAVANTSLAYVIDTSASTEDPGQCGGDANQDGLTDTILDCEVAAALRLHEEVVASGTVDRVALIWFSGHAAAQDLDPTDGSAVLVSPTADADADGVLDVVEAIRSLRHAGGTNFVNSTQLACQVLAGAGTQHRLGAFLSDGVGTGDLRTVLPCDPAVTFEVFAAGAGSSCSTGLEGSRLVDLATLSGGSCRNVPRVADLPDLLPDVIASEVTAVEYAVDGGTPVDLTAGLGLPRSGPVRLDLDLALPADLTGQHRVCLTVTGRDAGGSSSETTCSDVTTATGTVGHAWRQVSGAPAQLDGASTPRPSYVAADDGRQVFELTVTDPAGGDATDQVAVDVVNVAPALTLQHEAAVAGDASRITGSITDAGLLDTHTATVDWGDGTVESVPVTAGQPGHGSFAAAHAYASSGSFVAHVVATDDDGGRAVVPLPVEVGSPVAPVAVWANSTSATASLDWGGGGGNVWGRVHTNGQLRFVGARKAVTGPSSYAGSLAADTTRNSFSPVPVAAAVQPFPFRPDLASYRPGAALARQAGAAYHDVSAQCSGGAWQPVGTVLAPGVYYSGCDIHLRGSDLGGRVTLVSEGRVKLSGSRPSFDPYQGQYLAIAGATGSRAIDVSAASSAFTGVLFSERGEISISGGGNRFSCGILGDQVSITGSDVDIRAGGCGPA